MSEEYLHNGSGSERLPLYMHAFAPVFPNYSSSNNLCIYHWTVKESVMSAKVRRWKKKKNPDRMHQEYISKMFLLIGRKPIRTYIYSGFENGTHLHLACPLSHKIAEVWVAGQFSGESVQRVMATPPEIGRLWLVKHSLGYWHIGFILKMLGTILPEL